eukprot:7383754-Prymnesium_polylepis.2
MAGDVLPAQLLVEGVPHGAGALPSLPGNKYVKAAGTNAGHEVGFKLAQAGADANAGRLTRTWLGHFAHTSNHWANIWTSRPPTPFSNASLCLGCSQRRLPLVRRQTQFASSSSIAGMAGRTRIKRRRSSPFAITSAITTLGCA